MYSTRNWDGIFTFTSEDDRSRNDDREWKRHKENEKVISFDKGNDGNRNEDQRSPTHAVILLEPDQDGKEDKETQPTKADKQESKKSAPNFEPNQRNFHGALKQVMGQKDSNLKKR